MYQLRRKQMSTVHNLEPIKRKSEPAPKRYARHYEGPRSTSSAYTYSRIENPDNFTTVTKLIKQNLFQPLYHAMDRRCERDISPSEISFALKNGHLHEQRLDKTGEFWRYTIIGETLSGKVITIVVTLNNSRTSLLILTVANKRYTSPKIALQLQEKSRESKRETKSPEKELTDARCFSLASFIKATPSRKQGRKG